MKHDDLNVECDNYEQWKAVLREELASATTFEIHCWNEETEWIAALGLLKVLAFDVSIPIMLFASATNMILNSVEYKKKNNNSGYIITVVAALFVYVVIIYNVFIG